MLQHLSSSCERHRALAFVEPKPGATQRNTEADTKEMAKSLPFNQSRGSYMWVQTPLGIELPFHLRLSENRYFYITVHNGSKISHEISTKTTLCWGGTPQHDELY